MGRLLRKKPVKKKKKQDGALENGALVSAEATSKTVGDVSGVEKKVKSLEAKKWLFPPDRHRPNSKTIF